MGEERLGSTTDMLSKSHSRETKGGKLNAGLFDAPISQADFRKRLQMEGEWLTFDSRSRHPKDAGGSLVQATHSQFLT